MVSPSLRWYWPLVSCSPWPGSMVGTVRDTVLAMVINSVSSPSLSLTGVRRFCADIKYMMGIELGCYWRLCWAYITPGLMTAVLLYTLVDMSALTYKGVAYPPMAHGKRSIQRRGSRQCRHSCTLYTLYTYIPMLYSIYSIHYIPMLYIFDIFTSYSCCIHLKYLLHIPFAWHSKDSCWRAAKHDIFKSSAHCIPCKCRGCWQGVAWSSLNTFKQL